MPIVPETAETARLSIPEPPREVSPAEASEADAVADSAEVGTGAQRAEAEATDAAIAPGRFWPPIPHRIEDLNLAPRVISDLFLRRVYMDGTSSLSSVAQALKLSPAIIDRIFRHFREERVLDVRGSTADDDYTFSLTNAGTKLAVSRMRLSQYVGPAPVSLSEYSAAVRVQTAKVSITKDVLERALSDLVITDDLVATLGPALVSQRTMFLYGPTGNGKTVIAERLHRIHKDTVLIPYAVEVDGQIIVLHDPIVHRREAVEPKDVDPRWVLCRRPFVVVGGELTADQLELRFDDASRTYAAPVQMKANNGMLVIDDFGRQVISPRKMLNRWIVPMDRRIDFLSLRYGVKFEIPFELMLVFSTNLEPSHLADEAFLRRMHNKIFLGGVDDDVFDQIFHRFVQSRGYVCDADAAEYVRKLCRDHGCNPLRACLPADLCSIARWVNEFNEQPGYLAKSDFEKAVELYFAKTTAFEDKDFNATTA